jgi:hypothetical protein
MRDHLTKKKPCPGVKDTLVLTGDIKEQILTNRVYHKPVEKKVANNIITNYNQYNNINNIVASMDAMDKLQHYMSFTGQALVEFETTVENKFKKASHKLDHSSLDDRYFFKEDRLLQMVGSVSEPSKHEDDTISSHNIIYDNKLKELKIYDGEWEVMSLDSGTKHYLERIQRNFLDSYERYLIRSMKSTRQGQDKAIFRDMLERYFAFIGCFELDPYCQDANDDQIMRPVSSSEDEETDDDWFRSSPSMTLSEEFYPLFQRIVKTLTKTHVNKMVRSVQDMIKRNSAKNVAVLNKQITKLFHMDETFRDVLLSIQY